MNELRLFEHLLCQPETYKSYLQEEYGSNSQTVILRRVLLRNVRRGILGRVRLNGTRGGEVLFYNLEKKYKIVIISKHRDFKYYVVDKIEKINNNTIILKNVKELINDKWIKLGEDLKIFIGNVVKVL